MKEFEREMRASMGSPEDCSVACVVGGRADGFTSCVVGMCSMKRAAELVEARQARVENETFIFGKLFGGDKECRLVMLLR